MSVIEWRNTTPKALDELPLIYRFLVYVLLVVGILAALLICAVGFKLQSLIQCAASGLFYGLVLGIGDLVFMGLLTEFKPKRASLQRTTGRSITTYLKRTGSDS